MPPKKTTRSRQARANLPPARATRLAPRAKMPLKKATRSRQARANLPPARLARPTPRAKMPPKRKKKAEAYSLWMCQSFR
jgi:hypothetical protein